MKAKTWKQILSFVLSLAMVLSVVGVNGLTVSAATGVRPEDGVTEDQPFAPGTGTSGNFRIPCLVTLDDGTIVAGCDARWSWQMDGGGLDTIVSYSKDNGKTWHYTFANYLGDNGNVANYDSTAFIDPAMATDGKTVWMIADFLPAGIALNGARYAPKTGHTGYDENHNLVFAAATDSVNGMSDSTLRAAAAYNYHLEKIEGAADDADSYYQLKDASGNSVTGYTIDAFLNIKGDGVDTNLFCGDSPYFPYPTNFLYMTKSEDGGATWSIPTFIDIKKASEQTLLVGPGRGMVTSSGRILFTAYEYTSGDRNSCAFYSDDNGVTWTRGASVSSQSSEAVATEADGRLYMFTRHGGYYVSEDEGATWSAKKEVGLTYNLGCQLTAITYSEKIDGKTAILFAAPSNTSGRSQGKVFVGLVQEDGSLDWAYEYQVTDGGYAYSCLAELSNGDMGLLYEGGSITYTSLSMDEILGKIKKIEVAAGTTYKVEDSEATAAPVITTAPDEKIATVTSDFIRESATHVLHAYAGNGTAGSPATFFSTAADTTADLASAEFTITQSGSNWTVYNESLEKYLDIHSASDQFTTTAYNDIAFEALDNGCFRIRRSGAHYSVIVTGTMKFDRYSVLDTSVGTIDYEFTLLKAKDTEAEGDIIPGYEKATTIESGSKYLIAYLSGDSVILLYPAASGSQQKLYGGLQEVNKSSLTITGVAKGTTTAVVDGIEYIITVTSAEIPVEKLSVTTGNYEPNGGASEGPADLVLDGNTGTMWHTIWSPAANAGREDHWITLEIDGDYVVDGLRYLPRQSGTNGIITKYRIEVSTDGENWTEVAAGDWAGNSTWKVVEFENSVAAKYVKLISVESMSDQSDRGNEFSSAAELRLLGAPNTGTDPQPPVEIPETPATAEEKETLSTAVGEAAAVEADKYTEETYAALAAAVEAANAVLSKEDATQTEVAEALAAIETAKAALVEKEIPVEPPVHEHTWSDWTAKSEATVFEKATETRTCAECGETEIREVGEVLKATITTNAKSNKITLKKNQKSTGFQITGLAKGDSIVKIESSNKKVVKVTSVNLKKGTCKLTAGKQAGKKAKLTITLKSGLKKVITVTVQKSAVKTTKITGLDKNLTLKKGETFTLKPVLVPFTSQDTVKFTSSKKSAVTVSSKGKIKAKKKGSATITVKAGKKTVRVKVTVK